MISLECAKLLVLSLGATPQTPLCHLSVPGWGCTPEDAAAFWGTVATVPRLQSVMDVVPTFATKVATGLEVVWGAVCVCAALTQVRTRLWQAYGLPKIPTTTLVVVMGMQGAHPCVALWIGQPWVGNVPVPVWRAVSRDQETPTGTFLMGGGGRQGGGWGGEQGPHTPALTPPTAPLPGTGRPGWPTQCPGCPGPPPGTPRGTSAPWPQW